MPTLKSPSLPVSPTHALPVWTPARKKPDSDTTVLISCPRNDEPVWLGYWDSAESTWRTVEGGRVAVSAWMQLPEPFKP